MTISQLKASHSKLARSSRDGSLQDLGSMSEAEKQAMAAHLGPAPLPMKKPLGLGTVSKSFKQKSATHTGAADGGGRGASPGFSDGGQVGMLRRQGKEAPSPKASALAESDKRYAEYHGSVSAGRRASRRKINAAGGKSGSGKSLGLGALSGQVEGESAWYEEFDGEWRLGVPYMGVGSFQGFAGVWQFGLPFQGHGERTDAHGNTFSGDFRDGEPWGGKGTWVDANERMYSGVWADGEGEGSVELAPERSASKARAAARKAKSFKFSGVWREGRPHDGSGSWVSDQMHRMDGVWKRGEIWTGTGHWRSSRNSSLYKGEFKDGKILKGSVSGADGKRVAVTGAVKVGGMQGGLTTASFKVDTPRRISPPGGHVLCAVLTS